MSESSPVEAEPSPTVLVGLSGGVDSSVAALLLKEQGYNVIAVTIALAEPQEGASSRSCCSPSLMTKAKAVADHLRIPHYAYDAKVEFRELVIDYFVREYSAGRTPNPCAKCNSRVRFKALLALAERFGAESVATGHYARLVGSESMLARGIDRSKDQSYVLAEVDPEVLSRCLFPLGDHTKDEVRRIAGENGLGELVSEESQDICFLPSGGYRDFLRERLGDRPGFIVDDAGNVISDHRGTYNYTIGQKKGLGHGGGRTLYVSGLDVERSEVRVSGPELAKVRSVRFTVSARHKDFPEGRVYVQLRSASKAVPGMFVRPDRVILDAGELGVAPGQTIVLYDGDEVLLGGTILSADCCSTVTRGAEEG